MKGYSKIIGLKSFSPTNYILRFPQISQRPQTAGRSWLTHLTCLKYGYKAPNMVLFVRCPLSQGSFSIIRGKFYQVHFLIIVKAVGQIGCDVKESRHILATKTRQSKRSES